MANYFLAPIGNDSPFMLSTGVAASGYKLFTYVAGSTTKQNTYQDNAGNTLNANPILLNSSGYPASGGNVVEIWGNTGVTYKFVLAPSTDTDPPSSPVWTRDNIALLNDISSSTSEWITGPTPTYISATSFSLVGDQTGTFHVGRRLKTTNTAGTVYSTITASVFTSLTTITVANDSGSLDSGLSSVSYGLLDSSNPSVPSQFITLLRSYLAGLTMSTAGSSTTMTIAAGQAVDSTNANLMTLASSIGKTTSSWAVGTGNGGLDTGTIATSTWYHFWIIKRTDTQVVDVLISLSATSPTMPANYTLKRRIGSGLTDGSSHWTAFTQDGDYFRWSASVLDINATNPGTSAVTATLNSVPTGVNVFAIFNAQVILGASSAAHIYISDTAMADAAPSTTAAPLNTISASASTTAAAMLQIMTNTSAQIRYRSDFSDASTVVRIATLGWIDRRGRDS